MIFINRSCQNLWVAVFVVACPMSVLKIQKQSPWEVLWKRVPKNYPKFTGSYRLEACNFIKKTPTRAYFTLLLGAVPAHNTLFQFLWAFSYSRNLELACCLGEGSSLNVSFLIHTAHILCLSKICPTNTGVFWRTLQSF